MVEAFIGKRRTRSYAQHGYLFFRGRHQASCIRVIGTFSYLGLQRNVADLDHVEILKEYLNCLDGRSEIATACRLSEAFPLSETADKMPNQPNCCSSGSQYLKRKQEHSRRNFGRCKAASANFASVLSLTGTEFFSITN